MMSDEDKVRHNARRRAARKVDNLNAEIDKIYEKPIAEWDDEEIARGRPRGSDGTFRGRKPKWITPAIQVERQRRLRQLMMEDLCTFAADGLQIIHQLVKDKGVGEDGKPLVSASVKLDGAKYLIDQVMGKAKVSMDVHQDNTLADLMGAVLLNPDGMPSHQIVDGEVVADQTQSGVEDDPEAELRSMD